MLIEGAEAMLNGFKVVEHQILLLKTSSGILHNGYIADCNFANIRQVMLGVAKVEGILELNKGEHLTTCNQLVQCPTAKAAGFL